MPEPLLNGGKPSCSEPPDMTVASNADPPLRTVSLPPESTSAFEVTPALTCSWPPLPNTVPEAVPPERNWLLNCEPPPENGEDPLTRLEMAMPPVKMSAKPPLSTLVPLAVPPDRTASDCP